MAGAELARGDRGLWGARETCSVSMGFGDFSNPKSCDKNSAAWPDWKSACAPTAARGLGRQNKLTQQGLSDP